MKRNALIRIILFSSIIVLLTAGLTLGILDHNRYDVIEAPIEVMPTIVDIQVLHPRIAADAVNVRTSPSSEATAIGMLRKDEWVDVTREELVNGTSWSYITGPVQGWVQSEYLSPGFEQPEPDVVETMEPAVEETMVTAVPDKESRIYKADQVRELEIEWVAGNITILAGYTNTIQISETLRSGNAEEMVCYLKEGELSIEFCRDDDRILNLSSPTKDLTITVPMDWVCEVLEVDAASADLAVTGMNIGKLEFDSASGICDLKQCTLERMDVDTASGDIRFEGSLQYLDVDAASANVTAVLSNTPSRLSLDSMSGDLDITLPEDAGFTLSMEGLSTNFSSDFPTWKQGSDHICADGSCRILLNAMSGDVVIRKIPKA